MGALEQRIWRRSIAGSNLRQRYVCVYVIKRTPQLHETLAEGGGKRLHTLSPKAFSQSFLLQLATHMRRTGHPFL